MIIIFSRNFEKEVDKLPAKIKEMLKNKLEIFRVDPYNQVLKNHKLKGTLRHYRSINISGDYRLFYESHDEDTIRLLRIGTHSELYGK